MGCSLTPPSWRIMVRNDSHVGSARPGSRLRPHPQPCHLPPSGGTIRTLIALPFSPLGRLGTLTSLFECWLLGLWRIRPLPSWSPEIGCEIHTRRTVGPLALLVVLLSILVENIKAGSALRDHLVQFFLLAFGSLRPGEGP